MIMMLSKRSNITTFVAIISFLANAHTVSASVFFGNDAKSTFRPRTSSCRVTNLYHQKIIEDENQRQMIARTFRRKVNPTTNSAAMAIPGYGIAEQVFVGGFANFLSVYNIVITARVLLSWFPQAQSVGILQPVFQITDPYLNLFRGLIPPVFGLDLSAILAFVTLNVLTGVTASVGAEITPNDRKKLEQSSHSPFPIRPYYNKRINSKKTTTPLLMSV